MSADTWGWTQVNVRATPCEHATCKPCEVLSAAPQDCRIMHATVPLDGLVQHYFNIERDSLFRPLGVGHSGGTSGLEVSKEDLAALEEEEGQDAGDNQLSNLRTSIELLEEALSIVFWRARAGLGFSKLKVHADGPHQRNKLLVRIGSNSTLDIYQGESKA